jgi:hypothetical protein
MNYNLRCFLFFVPFVIIIGVSCNQTISGKFLNAFSSDSVAYKLKTIQLPAYASLCSFDKELTLAQLRNAYWVETPGEAEEKLKQKMFVNADYQKLKTNLKSISDQWSSENRKKLSEILSESDPLIDVYKDNMETLAIFSDYNDATKKFPVFGTTFDSDGYCVVHYHKLRQELDVLEEKLLSELTNSANSLQ